MEPKTPFRRSMGLKISVALLLLGCAAASNAQDEGLSAVQVTPTLRRHVMLPSKNVPDPSLQRVKPQLSQVAPSLLRPNNTASGVVYTCASNVPSSTCNYLNTTVAGYYNSIFTNANANIYVQFGATGLGGSLGYINLVPYSKYIAAVTKTSPKSSLQVSALSSINTYAATPYGSGNMEVTVALGTALGFTGLLGITPAEAACTPGTAGCYNEIVTVADAQHQAAGGFTLYYDDQGGTEASNQYDFYAVVQHETDEVLGTSSCISTQGASLSDECDFSGGTGVPSAVDLMRYSSPGHLALDTAPTQTAGQYFSYDGGVDYGIIGRASTPTPKVYNTLNNGDDFADYTSSSPDCGTNEAIQDAEGCPGEDAGMNVINDGQSELTILNAIGFSIPESIITTPAPGGSLGGTSATFHWNSATGATAYWVYVGTTGVGSSNIFANSAEITTTSQAVTGLPTSGTVYVRLYSLLGGVFWTATDFTFKGGTSTTTPTTLTSPAQGSTFAGPSVTFTWAAAAGANGYFLHLGTTGAGSLNLLNSAEYSSGSTSVTVNALPVAGATIYARLFTDYNGDHVFRDYTFTASKQAALTTPAQGTMLAGPSVTFDWSAATGSRVKGYFLHLGTTGVGSLNVLNSAEYSTSTTSVTVSNLPLTGGTLYARVFTDYNGTHLYKDYTFTEAKQATLTTPTPSTTLSGASVTFGWSAATGSNFKGYFLHLGTTGVGSMNLLNSGEYSTSTTSVTVNNLPTTGGTVYARVFTDYNGIHVYKDYTYTAK